MPIKGAPAQLVVDFTNVRESSGYTQTYQEPGDYAGVVKSVEYGQSKENKTPMLTYMIADKLRPSATYRYNCPLTENSLWKFRNLLVACGVNVPKKKVNILGAAEKIVGRDVGMSLDDEEYNGKVRSQITTVFPAADLPVEEAGKTKKSKAAPADDADEPTEATPADDDVDTEEDLDELDLDDL